MKKTAKRADDAPRRVVRDRIAALGMTMKAVSAAMGRNPAYVQQYLDRWIPRDLPEKARAQLAGALGIDETTLRPTLSPQSTGGVNEPSTNIEKGLSLDEATGEQEAMIDEETLEAVDILAELPQAEYMKAWRLVRQRRKQTAGRPPRRA